MDTILVLWLLFLIFRLGFELGRSFAFNQVKKIIDKNQPSAQRWVRIEDRDDRYATHINLCSYIGLDALQIVGWHSLYVLGVLQKRAYLITYNYFKNKANEKNK